MKTIARIGLVILSVAVIGVRGTQAQAGGAVSNLDEESIAGWPISHSLWYGAAFVTGGEATQLESIALQMGTGSSQPDQPMVLALYYATEEGKVGTNTGVTFQASPSDSDNSSGQFTWTPLSTFQLASSTRYWVALTSATENGGDYSWEYTDSTQFTSQGGWSLKTGYALSTNQGATWSEDTGLTPKFSVSANAVPEPGSAVLMTLGAVGIFIVICRRGRSSSGCV